MKAQVLYNGRFAGILEKSGGLYRFTYDHGYLTTAGSRPVSITLPLRKDSYESDVLFPAFVNMLSEGANKRIQCRLLKIDEYDYFSLLLAAAGEDNIGAITINKIDEAS
jgi:HipA-like protein